MILKLSQQESCLTALQHGLKIAVEKGNNMYKNTVKAIIDVIDNLAKMGALKTDEHKALKKEVRELLHAISVKNINLIEKAVSKIAKLLLRDRHRQP